MLDIFDEAQKGMQAHNKLIKNLLKIYNSVSSTYLVAPIV